MAEDSDMDSMDPSRPPRTAPANWKIPWLQKQFLELSQNLVLETKNQKHVGSCSESQLFTDVTQLIGCHQILAIEFIESPGYLPGEPASQSLIFPPKMLLSKHVWGGPFLSFLRTEWYPPS